MRRRSSRQKRKVNYAETVDPCEVPECGADSVGLFEHGAGQYNLCAECAEGKKRVDDEGGPSKKQKKNDDDDEYKGDENKDSSDDDYDDEDYDDEDYEYMPEEDDWTGYILDNKVNQEKIDRYKGTIQTGSETLYEQAPPSIQNALDLLYSGSISTAKTKDYYNTHLAIEAVLKTLVPSCTVLYFYEDYYCGRVHKDSEKRKERITEDGLYYIVFSVKKYQHAVAILKVGENVYLYDANGRDDMKNREVELYFDLLQQTFGEITGTAFAPHKTEFQAVLTKNIFLTLGGRCAVWALFICIAFESAEDLEARRKDLDKFVPLLVGNDARIISCLLVSLYTRILWLFHKPSYNYTPMEKALLSPVVTKEMSVAYFKRLKEMRPRLRKAVRARGMEKKPYFTTPTMGQKRKLKKWTTERFLDTVQKSGHFVINQYAKGKTRLGKDIPPPPHIKLKISMRVTLTWYSTKGKEKKKKKLTVNVRASVPIDSVKEKDQPIQWKKVLEWTNKHWKQKFGKVLEDIKMDPHLLLHLDGMTTLFTEKTTPDFEHFGNTYVQNEKSRNILHINIRPSSYYPPLYNSPSYVPILSTTKMVLHSDENLDFMLTFKEVDLNLGRIERIPNKVKRKRIVPRQNFKKIPLVEEDQDCFGPHDTTKIFTLIERRARDQVFVSVEDARAMRTIAQVIAVRKNVVMYDRKAYQTFKQYKKSLKPRTLAEERKRLNELYESAVLAFEQSKVFLVKKHHGYVLLKGKERKRIAATNNILDPDHHKNTLEDLQRAYFSSHRNKLNDIELRRKVSDLLEQYFGYRRDGLDDEDSYDIVQHIKNFALVAQTGPRSSRDIYLRSFDYEYLKNYATNLNRLQQIIRENQSE